MPQPTDDANLARRLDAILAMRELARRHYRDFLKYAIEATRSRIQWSWYLDMLCDVLHAVNLGQIKRLIINIPPRHAKSTIVSQLWQAWRIGRDNSDQSSVLSCAASLVLAARDSRKTLNTIRSDWYQALFPAVEFLRENEVDWETKGGARRMAVGRGGTVIGRGANTIVWDDLLKSDEGMSEVERPKCNEWLGEVLASRLDDPKQGVVVGIMQRLHELDPTGYLIEQAKIPGADQYTHVCIPLEAPHRTIVQFGDVIYKIRQTGELIDPSRIGKDEVAALKISMRDNFDGQYNQNPVKMVGSHLNPTLLSESNDSAAEIQQKLGLQPCAYLDFSATEKQLEKNDPDENTISIVARDQFNRMQILDVWGKVCGYEELANTLISMHKLWNFRVARCERGSLYNLFAPILRQRMLATGHFLVFDQLPSTNSLGDKVRRSMTFQGMLNAGAVSIPSRLKAPWLQAFEKQMRAFPRGAHDDRLEGAWYAAIDFENMPKGETPASNPASGEALELFEQKELKDRIQKAADERLNPGSKDTDDW